MMIEPHIHYHNLSRTSAAQNPSRVAQTDPTAAIFSSLSSPMPFSPLSVSTTATTPNGSSSPNGNRYLRSDYDDVLAALCRYIQSNDSDGAVAELAERDELAVPIDGAYASTDEFRMYEFKVRPCTRAKAHDWTECPFAHPGEKARRRDPRRYPYSGTACTDFRKGSCLRGDACEFAHGVFECWLHPARYRTQACKDGPNCTRRVCFFAHSSDQLRVVSGLPSPRSIGSGADPFEDPLSGPESSSPPVTPIGRAYGPGTVNELMSSLRNMQLSKLTGSFGSGSLNESVSTGSGWKLQMGVGSPRFGSTVGKGFYSLPTTPTRPTGPGYPEAEEPVMERVESGRELRAKMFARLSRENPLTLPDPVESGEDVGWVTELVK